MMALRMKTLPFLACFVCLLHPLKADISEGSERSPGTDPSESGEADQSREVSGPHSLIWGPGLKPNFVVPARYFFIQAVDETGVNFTRSVGDKAFSVNIHKAGGATARAWIQVLDRFDGSYIVRYKLFEHVRDMTIQVWYSSAKVGQSPYLLKGNIYQEKCVCPNELKDWLSTMECPSSYSQIKRDLQLFPSIDMTKVAKEAIERFNQRGRHSLCHYVVKDNKVYRKTYGEHVGFKMFMDAILLSLTRKVTLPDLELFVNLGDWPLEKKSVAEVPIPIFSWCGSDDTRDIVMPTYDVTESTLETMGRCEKSNLSLEMPTYQTSEEKLSSTCRVTLDLLSVQGNSGVAWQDKTDMAFWRGRDSRQERLNLVRMANTHPNIIDAKLTNMFFFKHETDLGEIVKHISFFDFFKHKYQVNIDGTVAAYRLPYLLGGNSLVLKQDSPYYEHFYKDLQPYTHYVPFKRDLSDLLEKIQWAKENDEKAKQIALNGQNFVQENLLAQDVFCYHVVLFEEYAKRLTSPVVVHDGMDLVEQPKDRDSKCDCHRNPKEEPKKKDEL